jgi:glycerate kinase
MLLFGHGHIVLGVVEVGGRQGRCGGNLTQKARAMRVVVAPDSFKESAPASTVAEAIAEGFRRVHPGADLVCIPMADGGEGTVDALVAATGGSLIGVEVTGPLGGSLSAEYGVLGDGVTAVIEMAAASGLHLAAPQDRDPAVATTYGTGELMHNALDRGLRRIIMGIGGSATNDGGAGMAEILGYGLEDAEGQPLPAGGLALARLSSIDSRLVLPALAACDVLVACDVDNPLCGPTGASHVYGPQKGASPEVAEELDRALRHFAGQISVHLGVDVLDIPGGGAAGGLGAGLVAFAGGTLVPGVELIAEACGLAEAIEGADLVITGEGRLDAQSANGKTPMGVARLAKSKGVPAIAIAGSLGEGYEALYEHGVHAAYSISEGITVEEAIARVEPLLADAAEVAAREWRVASA